MFSLMGLEHWHPIQKHLSLHLDIGWFSRSVRLSWGSVQAVDIHRSCTQQCAPVLALGIMQLPQQAPRRWVVVASDFNPAW